MYSTQKSKAIIFTSLLSIIIGGTVITGWIFNIQGLQIIFPWNLAMKFNSALCFIFIGVALIITQLKIKKYNTLIVISLSFFVTLIGFISLSEDVFHYYAGIDQLFFIDKAAIARKYPFPGRMAVNTAICFVLLGLSFIGSRIKKRLIYTIAQYLLHLVTAISAVAIIGYLYGLSVFYNFSYISSMTARTAILLFFISVAASLLHPSLGITALFTGNLVGNKMARRIFLMMILTVIVFGSLRLQSQYYHQLSSGIGTSLLSLCFLLVSLAIIWNTANWLNKIDLKRYEAEEEIKVMNEALEQRVQERSAELFNLLEKFRESESKFRAAFEYSAIGMALVSLDGKWLKVNKSLCELVGYSENELTSMHFLDITHPDDVTLHINIIDGVLKTESGISKFEKRYIHKNGSTIWASVNFASVKDDAGQPLYFVTQLIDITERKKAEDAQKLIVENEERLRAIFDNVEGATCLVDTNFRLIIFNNVFAETIARLAGKAPNIGDEGYGFLSEEEKKQRHEILNRVLTGKKETLEANYERNGKRFYYRTNFNPVIVDSKVTAISSYTIDLTSSKEAENKIRKTDARFRAIVESVFVGIKLNDSDWNIIYRSPSMQAINGWTDEEMNQRYLELVHPDDIKSVTKAHKDVLLTPGVSVNIIYRILHKNGSYIWIESLICNKLSDPDLEAIITVTRDISKPKLVEDELKKSEEKYRTLIEHASDAIYLVDYKGNFIDVNDSMCIMSGYDKTELLQLNIEELIDPDQLKTDPIKHGPREPNYTVIRERRFVHKDGHIFDVEINVKQFADDSTLVIARDITIRKQMEIELREAELKFRILAEKSMVGVYISQGEKLIYVNPRFAEIFGYKPNELTSITESAIEILYLNEDKPIVRKNVEARYKGEIETINYEVTGKKKNGTFIQVEFYGSSVTLNGVPTIIGTMLDVTERRNAEEVLKRSEANLKSIMDTTDTAYILLDKKLNVMLHNKKAIKFVNDQHHIFPEKSDQFVDYFPKKGALQALLNDADPLSKERLTAFIKNTKDVLMGKNISYEIDYPQSDGSVTWFYVRLFPLAKDKQEIFGLMVELSDITERKSAEENLKTAYLKIQKHVDSIKEMAWKQSHLIRGPIANLKGLAAMLKENPLDAEALRFTEIELERLDEVIIDMAEDVSDPDL